MSPSRIKDQRLQKKKKTTIEKLAGIVKINRDASKHFVIEENGYIHVRKHS